MSAWIERVTADFQREFATLWVVSDPDEILLTPDVAHLLAERGIEVVPYRDPLAFRLLYETEIRSVDATSATIVHVRGDTEQVVPWDVLQRARRVTLSIPELFTGLDPVA